MNTVAEAPRFDPAKIYLLRAREHGDGNVNASNTSMTIPLKPYPAAWTGLLVLACRKCQKKLKKEKRSNPLANLKKAVKVQNRKSQDEQLHVLNVPCMDLCPKHGVTVCAPARWPEQLFILRSASELAALLPSRDSLSKYSSPPGQGRGSLLKQ